MSCKGVLTDIVLDCDYKAVRGLKNSVLLVRFEDVDRVRTMTDAAGLVSKLQLKAGRRGYMVEVNGNFKVTGTQKLSEGYQHELRFKFDRADGKTLAMVEALRLGAFVAVVQKKDEGFEVLGLQSGLVLTSAERSYGADGISVVLATPSNVREGRMVMACDEKHISNLHRYDGTLKVVGVGYGSAHTTAFIVKGKKVDINTGRGLNLVVLNRATLEVLFTGTYDLYADEEKRTELATRLNSLDNSVIVMIASLDSFNLNEALINALQRCGGSINSKTETSRLPYALIGIPGIGAGAGIEKYTTNVGDVPAEIETDVFNAMPQGIKQDAFERAGDYREGGRNLLLDSKKRKTVTATTGDESWLAEWKLSQPLKEGQTYIFDVTSYKQMPRYFLWAGDWGTDQEIFPQKPFVAKRGYTLLRAHQSGLPFNLDIEKVKLEQGSRVTDWTPAPEDGN